MIANYHTHTWRCRHAWDTEREYVERAIEGGIKILGFSDHTPYRHLDSPDNTVRMEMREFEGYVDMILKLRDEYAADIQIYLGAEVEYYPDYFEDLMRFFEGYPVEYMILGQHFLYNEVHARYSGTKTFKPEHLIQYVNQSIEAMDTGRFLYMAHPDLLNYIGDDGTYNREYKRLCEAAKERKLPLEINLLGLRGHRWYPDERFWKLAGEVGNDVILGCDAHRAIDVWDPVTEKCAEEMVQKYHLHLIDRIDIVSRKGGA